MGRLDTMPAYYLLKWVNPMTLSAGGFGNDPTTPLAMLPEGFGSLVDALAAEAGLDVRLNATVTLVDREGGGSGGGPVRLVVETTTTSGGGGASGTEVTASEEFCDLVALSGPITEFVRGSNDGARGPILQAPTEAEVDLFAPKQAMQFLIQLLELEPSPVQVRACACARARAPVGSARLNSPEEQGKGCRMVRHHQAP